MNYFTSGYELSTAITNLFITLVSFILFFKLKKYKDKLWNTFYLTIALSGLLGFIIHGIIMKEPTTNFYWAMLILLMCFAINMLLAIFLNKISIMKNIKITSIILLSILVYIVLLIELIFGINFIVSFMIYTCVCLLIMITESIYFIYKKKYYSIFYIIAIIFQIIGGFFLIYEKKLFIFDKNAIYHIYTILTLLFFYIGCEKELMLKKH